VRCSPIALGSSKNARPILEKTGLLSYFDAVVDGNDVTNAKPDPEVFNGCEIANITQKIRSCLKIQ
jgi:beta-phosphoglucomutase